MSGFNHNGASYCDKCLFDRSDDCHLPESRLFFSFVLCFCFRCISVVFTRFIDPEQLTLTGMVKPCLKHSSILQGYAIKPTK